MPNRLGELQPGHSGVVKTVGAGSPAVKRRLVDMGITPMTELYVKKIAPLGDPIEISLRGYSLSIRKEDADEITLLTEQEKQTFLKREKTLQADFDQRVGTAQFRHEIHTDLPAHKSAAKLTEWVLSTAGQSCPTGGCATCAGCGGKQGRNWKKRAATGERGKSGRPASDDRPVTLALVGNPNAGKTTLFNAVTGAKEYVGNWPGVTVEKKERHLNAYGHDMTIVDLPGIYSLSTYSMEEIVARNFVVDEHPDAIINIVDATNLERNLYLTIQLMELETPMILALNMMDEVTQMGISIDVRRLALELGVPVVPICARTGQGVEELLQNCATILSLAHEQMHRGFCIEPDDLYDEHTHAAHHRIGQIIGDAPDRATLPMHWTEIKLLEGDPLVRQRLSLSKTQSDELDQLLAAYAGEGALGDNETRVADSRYQYITRVCGAAVRRKATGEKTVSDRIDAVLTNQYLGIPIFLLIMGLIFILTFDTLGGWLADGAEQIITLYAIPLAESLLLRIHAADWIISLVCDGVLTGVGGVLTFLPQIALLFFFLSLLEDSGYMSRTAFLMDRALKRFGLSGKSFIPMLMGFGCTVPATMSARTMENEDDRRMTIMLLPFMSCSAKLPVYGLIASAFFAHARGLIVLSLYVLGIVIGIITGLLFRKTLFRKNHAAFVMELPPYRMPSLKNTMLHVGERVQHFIEKAGSIILVMSVVLWFLTRFDLSFSMTAQTQDSILGRFGSFLAPVFTPLGFGTWEASVALLSGLIAKEAVVSSLSLFLGVSGSAALSSALGTIFTPLAAYSFLVFVLLYVPCIAAVTTMRKELHSAKYTWFMVAYQMSTAYIVALLVHTIGSLFA
ncbi:MAG: ferrous iron transport protein B [Clostridia bacterium]